jgi:hypothetical protein
MLHTRQMQDQLLTSSVRSGSRDEGDALDWLESRPDAHSWATHLLERLRSALVA